MASVWEPVATAGRSGSVPAQRMKMLPTASSRTSKPSVIARFFSHARARRSSAEKTTRVTALPSLAGCAEPLRAERSHPDEVAGGDGVPLVAEPIDAAAFEHQQTMLHDVYLDHAECGARLIGHRIDGEVEGGRAG